MVRCNCNPPVSIQPAFADERSCAAQGQARAKASIKFWLTPSEGRLIAVVVRSNLPHFACLVQGGGDLIELRFVATTRSNPPMSPMLSSIRLA
jgi:hypothetical protein